MSDHIDEQQVQTMTSTALVLSPQSLHRPWLLPHLAHPAWEKYPERGKPAPLPAQQQSCLTLGPPLHRWPFHARQHRCSMLGSAICATVGITTLKSLYQQLGRRCVGTGSKRSSPGQAWKWQPALRETSGMRSVVRVKGLYVFWNKDLTSIWTFLL